MHRFYAIAAIFFIVGSPMLNAATYKGQKVYIESCKECHGGGQALAASKKQREWKKVMDNNGDKLAEIHLSTKKAQLSWDYFGSRNYSKDARHLEDFLVEYAGDSGNVPACN